MRAFFALSCVFAFLTAASAANLKVRVVDPQSAAVAGAQVSLLRGKTPLRVATSAGDGTVSLGDMNAGEYQVQVLAAGFARQTLTIAVPQVDVVTVQLHLPRATETVVVTATRTPVPATEAGSSVSALDSGQLLVMQPLDASDALRFLPGVVAGTAGQRGGLASLFVRGGDSRYNKVMIDGVPANEPGGTFDFGVWPLAEAGRVELARGAQSTLYGSDAMTSVVQVFSRTGSTSVPELRLAADGGNLGTAHGFAALSGARGRFDYNFFGDQFNSAGNGVNDDYSNSLQGANVGVQLAPNVQFRLRTRHMNSRTGVQGEWDFNGQQLFPPDMEQRARRNDLLGSSELTVSGPSGWQHRFTGFEYNLRRLNEDDVAEPARAAAFDSPFHTITHLNRAGFEYQGDYAERSWAHTTVGYEFEDENGFLRDLDFGSNTNGLRLNHAVYGQQGVVLGRASIVAGARFVHNETFGNKVVPRVALAYQVLHGGQVLSGTRLRFSYATGIKEPRFEESFPSPFVNANPNLKAEENRAFETGFEQGLSANKYLLSAIYFNNLFHNQIDFNFDLTTGKGTYFNVNKSIAHGAEVELKGHVSTRLLLDAAYNYTSAQILDAPFESGFPDGAGNPLIRRPRHSGSLLFTYLGNRWGANLAGSFVGRRADSDFLGLGFNHAAGYARVDLGGWYAINSRVSAYANVENALDRQYNEVVGYPVLPVNFRAGLRFRVGGE